MPKYFDQGRKVLPHKMYDTRKNMFENDLNYFVTFDIEQTALIEKLKQKFNDPLYPTGSRLLSSFETGLQNSQQLSTKILNVFDSIDFANQDLADHIIDLNSTIQWIKSNFTVANLELRDLNAINVYLSYTRQVLAIINDIINLNFNYLWIVTTETATELENYDSRGLLINSDPEYEGSPIGLLERFVLDRVNSLREYIGKDLVIDNDSFSKLFFAIVAPSMTGKTQAAFAFKRLRPLYFLLCESSKDILQEIYKNFDVLSETFRNFIDDDFEKLKRLNLASKGDIFDQISSTNLRSTHSATKFKTLGFIYSMIMHGEEFDRNRNNYQTWMNFYAKSPRHFTIEEKSLRDLENFSFGNYVLFFDEFEASVANAFVRNLFRTAFLPVFAANTNSNAANLVGKIFSAGSRIADSFAWSLAAIKLNSINRSILTGMHPLLISNISTIIGRSLNPIEEELIQSFFDDFLENQLIHLRPGFADIIATKINSISTQSGFTLNSILHEIVSEVSFKLAMKKPAMKRELEGILGSLALFMDNAYLSSGISHEALAAKMGHIKSYLQCHFYYLINPVNVNKWCFLTYRPEPGSTHLRVIFQNNTFKDWTVEYTYFKAEEIIPFFACQAILSSISIPMALRTGLIISDANALTTGRASNPSQRVPLMGEELEILSSICIVEASQHDFGHSRSTFMGQDGESFLKNLIENLVEADDYRRNNKFKLNCAIILRLLKRIHIPFLFPAGMKLPDLFRRYFSIPQGFLTRSVNFGEYKRTKNSTQIDGIFGYFIKNDAEAVVGVCSVECKNWRANLLATDLVPILKKAKRKSAHVALLICNSIGNSKDETLEAFVSFCNNVENKYLVLKMIESSENNFKLVPYCPGLLSAKNAALVCIIIELDVINPDRSRRKTSRNGKNSKNNSLSFLV